MKSHTRGGLAASHELASSLRWCYFPYLDPNLDLQMVAALLLDTAARRAECMTDSVTVVTITSTRITGTGSTVVLDLLHVPVYM